MSIFRAMNINTSGLTAERLRMDTISSNIANADTTRTPGGGPYVRRVAVFEEHVRREMDNITGRRGLRSHGIRAVGIYEDPSPLPLVFDPDHPDAREDGYVEMPNVNVLTEMIDMMASRRAFEANVTALNTSKAILMKSLEIGR